MMKRTANSVAQLLDDNVRFWMAAQAVSVRRFWYGPQKPNWSWWMESMVQFLRLQVPRGEHIQAAEMRELVDRVVQWPLAGDVRISPVVDAPAPGEWVETGQTRATGTIVYAHGGGYVSGAPCSSRSLTVAIARATNLRVLAVDYRLAPEHPHPAAVDDICAMYGWLLTQGVHPSDVIFVGDSAGGGLIVAALLALRAAQVPLPAAAVCLSPWLDLALTGASIGRNAPHDYLNHDILRACVRMYLNGHEPTLPLISPVYADLRGLPPLLIQVGTAELLLDETLLFAERARAAGVTVQLETWENMVHVWHMLHWMEPAAQRALTRVGDFTHKVLSCSAAFVGGTV